MESDQLNAAATKCLTIKKKHGASGNSSKKSPDQSKTCFKLIFDHQNLGIDTSCAKISVILAEI